MKLVTRVFALPKELNPHAEAQLLWEWPLHIPDVAEGGMLQVGSVVYRVRYKSVMVNEAAGEVVACYTVQDAREKLRT